jgi:alkanesulfonate monooxygenase SsuD/methylene tetrahydromethanopterin reductase-like flavin-dependent oxidoreductase (luciferase family)
MQPIQKRIPILWGGFSPQGVARAAERGYHLIAPDVTGTYERVMREQGRQPEKHLIGFVTMLNIAGTREEAFAATAPHALWVNNIYALRRNLEGTSPRNRRESRQNSCGARGRAERLLVSSTRLPELSRISSNITCRSCVARAGSSPILVSRCGHPVPLAKLRTAR